MPPYLRVVDALALGEFLKQLAHLLRRHADAGIRNGDGNPIAAVFLHMPRIDRDGATLRELSLCTCRRQYPGTATGRTNSLNSPESCQPSPIWQSGRPVHCPFRGLLGVHSRYGLHTRAVTVYRDTLSEGFSHFVTSMTAPVASGWSGCRVGLARRLGGHVTVRLA